MPYFYTDAEDKLIKEHMDAGLSALKSAIQITAIFGIPRSRNAIIGRRSRLGLELPHGIPGHQRNAWLKPKKIPADKPIPLVILLAENFPDATIIELAEAVAGNRVDVSRRLETRGLSRPMGDIRDFGKADGEPTPARKRVAEMRASLVSEAA